MIVHVEGFTYPRNSSYDIFGAVVEGEYGFPASNIKYVSSVTSRIVECTIIADSFPAFERALGSPKCRLTLLDSFDVSVPLTTAASIPQALSNFKNRLTKSVASLSVSTNPLSRHIAALLVNYRDKGDRTWTPPPRPTLTYKLSDYVKVQKDVEMRSSGAAAI